MDPPATGITRSVCNAVRGREGGTGNVWGDPDEGDGDFGRAKESRRRREEKLGNCVENKSNGNGNRACSEKYLCCGKKGKKKRKSKGARTVTVLEKKNVSEGFQ